MISFYSFLLFVDQRSSATAFAYLVLFPTFHPDPRRHCPRRWPVHEDDLSTLALVHQVEDIFDPWGNAVATTIFLTNLLWLSTFALTLYSKKFSPRFCTQLASLSFRHSLLGLSFHRLPPSPLWYICSLFGCRADTVLVQNLQLLSVPRWRWSLSQAGRWRRLGAFSPTSFPSNPTKKLRIVFCQLMAEVVVQLWHHYPEPHSVTKHSVHVQMPNLQSQYMIISVFVLLL